GGVSAPGAGAAAAALAGVIVLGTATVGAANPAGVRDSVGEALGITQPEGECAGSLGAGQSVLCGWGRGAGDQPVVQQDIPGDVVALAAGADHALALLADGTVLAWGSDEFGQLGNGPGRADSAEPVAVAGIGSVQAIAAGDHHSLALRDDGVLFAWGQNDYGQLGNGDVADFDEQGFAREHLQVEVPAQIEAGAELIQIAAGGNHSVALLNDGTVSHWGSYLSSDPQLASGPAIPLPTVVAGVEAVRSLAAGANHTIALITDGTLRSWGSDEFGQLGDGVDPSPTFARRVEIDEVKAIAAGGDHALALRQDGSVWAWGRDDAGQLGDGGELAARFSPAQVSGLLDVIGVAAGNKHSLALLRDGSLRGWGDGDNGELGNGSSDDHSTPVRVEGLRGVSLLAAGGGFSLALRGGGGEEDKIALTKGDWVAINADDGCADPSELPPSAELTNNPRLACPPNGTVVQIVGGPVEFEESLFWATSGFGWLNEIYLTFDHEGSPPYPERPELADEGLIAFVGADQGLWLMDADGTDRRRINRGPVLSQPQWSPDSRLLAFEGDGRVRIIDLWGAMLLDLPGFHFERDYPWFADSLAVVALQTDADGPRFLARAGVDGSLQEISDEAVTGDLPSAGNHQDWALFQRDTIVYPEFSPLGISSWIGLEKESGEITILGEGSLPAWQPEALNEAPVATRVEAVEQALRYFPGLSAEPCIPEAEGACLADLGDSRSERVFGALRADVPPQLTLLLFVRPEGDGYVVGHIEPPLCQGDAACPPPAGAIVEIVVQETCANVRLEPGLDGPLERCVPAGETFIVTGEAQEVDARLWVELEGGLWVSASYIRCLDGCG
ncbi:MAG: hypothetical protein WEB00_16135, partial [Dehalococcoidia bacterium]